jgi:MerR family copper efflux transcriptional regulator
MQIREAAARSGVAPKTIRYYEEVGLVAAPARTEGGYRDYDESELATLAFVKRARDLGFSLKDVSALLDLWRNQNRSSAEVKSLTERHIADIEHRMSELSRMRDTLRTLAVQCHGDDRPNCPIIDQFSGGAEQS